MLSAEVDRDCILQNPLLNTVGGEVCENMIFNVFFNSSRQVRSLFHRQSCEEVTLARLFKRVALADRIIVRRLGHLNHDWALKNTRHSKNNTTKIKRNTTD